MDPVDPDPEHCHVACKFSKFFHKPPTIYRYHYCGKQLLLSNDRNRVRGAVFSLSQDGEQHKFVLKFPQEQLKARPIDTTANPPFFSVVNTFKRLVSLSILLKREGSGVLDTRLISDQKVTDRLDAYFLPSKDLQRMAQVQSLPIWQIGT